MKYILPILFPLCLLLPSCSFVRAIEETAKETKRVVTEAKEVLQQAKVHYQEAKEAADTDKDGKTSLGEWLAYIVGGGAGLGGFGAWVRKQLKSLDAKAGREFATLHDRVDHERGKRKAKEAAEIQTMAEKAGMQTPVGFVHPV